MMPKGLSQFFVRNRYIILLIVFGSLTWSLTMVRSGLNGQFWGANAHDGIWHIALANSLARGSLEMPTFAGETLRNYHIGFDFAVASIHKLTGIPTINLYFQIIPVILAVVVGTASYIFVNKWRKSDAEAFWATFFVYFGGSWAWIFGKQDSMFWSQQSITTLINPPYALSLLFLLLGLIMLIKYTKKTSLAPLLLATILFGLLSQIKIYAFLLAVGGLLVAGLWELFTERKYKVLSVWLGSVLLGIFVFVPINSLSAGTLIFQPFWFLETMMLFPDRVGWVAFYEAMRAYTARDEWLKALAAYLAALVIFMLGNFWSRIVGILASIKGFKNWKKLSIIQVFIYTIIATGITLPMLFVQTGTAWNTIQFFYYSLFFAGILAGTAIVRLHKYLIFAVVLLTIPTTIFELVNIYLTQQPSYQISLAERDALNFLREQPEGIVLTYPTEHSKSLAYVSAYSNKGVYLEDEINLNIMAYDWQLRRADVEDFYANTTQEYKYDFLRSNAIEYIYLLDMQGDLFDESQLGLEKIFENEEVVIYEVSNAVNPL